MISREAQQEIEDLTDAASRLAGRAGIYGLPSLTPLHGGRNNRVFRLRIEKESYLLKSYFRHEKDPRDRLGTEYSFLSLAWSQGLRMIPRPIISDRRKSLGLYEFIEGRKMAPGEITDDHVAQALDFYLALNHGKDAFSVQGLPKASEACFSIVDHLDLVDCRLKRLMGIDPLNGLEEMQVFIHDGLSKAWTDMKRRIFEKAQALGIDVDRQLPSVNWVLSPSDFGFHNTILEDSGRLRFIDFEYAGWDDPAKMVCDFFCQPEVPVPPDYFSGFQDKVIAAASDREALRERIGLLLPAYRIKWCCIILNDFLPEGKERRDFSNQRSQEKRRSAQLQKARRYFADWIEVDDKRNCPAEKS